MGNEFKEEIIFENSKAWNVTVQLSNGVKAFELVNLPKLKDTLRRARDAGDETPIKPVEYWILQSAFRTASPIMNRTPNVKLMLIEILPKSTKL